MELADIRPYLFRIATNLLHDRWRRRISLQLTEVDEPSSETYPEKALDAARMLHRLKPRARELLWLAYMEGMTHREIADATGLNVMSVRILLLRARREAATLLRSKGKDNV
jgi:RNA polymerase sigma-70 factor (ECF subfamily)